MTNEWKKRHGSIHIGSTPWDSSWPELVNDFGRSLVFGYLEERFGISPSVFNDYLLFRRRESWYILRRSPRLPEACRLKISKVGLKAFHKVGRFLKPTTRFIQVFGHLAPKAKVELNDEKLGQLIGARAIRMDLPVETGYVILTLSGVDSPLGLGFYADGKLHSQLPKKELRAKDFKWTLPKDM